MSMFHSARPTDKVGKDAPIPSWRDHPEVQKSSQRIAEHAKRYARLQAAYDEAAQAVPAAQAHYDEVHKLYLQGVAEKAEKEAAKQGLTTAEQALQTAEDALAECGRELRLLREGQHEIAGAVKEVVIGKLRTQYAAALAELIDAFEALETANRRVRRVHEAAEDQFPTPLHGDYDGYPSSAGLMYLGWDELFTPETATAVPSWAPWMPARDSQTQLARWLPEAKQHLAQMEALIEAEAKAQKENKAS